MIKIKNPEIYLYGLVLPILGSFISIFFFQAYIFEHELFHAFLETLGAISAFVSLTLMHFNRKQLQHLNSDITWITSALLGMGILDIFHVLVHVGNNFIFFHSAASFVGGLFFAGIYLPSKFADNKLPYYVSGLSIGIGLFAFIFPEQIPNMLNHEKFSVIARILNLLGGIGFIIATVHFSTRFYKANSKEDYFFSIHTLLFGSAAILFEISVLWDMAWWWWHLLRLLAYLVLAFFFFDSYKGLGDEIENLNNEINKANKNLTTKVEEITAENEQQKKAAINIMEDAIEAKHKLQESQNALKEQALELERSNFELKNFAYITSHDLQEPLRLIINYIELLAMDFKDKGIVLDDKAKKYFYFITDASLRMRVLIQDVLNYSRIGHETKIEKVDLNKILAEIQADLANLITEKDAQINIDSKLPVIYGSKTELRQLFQNLISNGLKFINPNLKPKINISLEKINSQEYQFSVKDNGIGIEKQYFDKIFIMFQRLHSREQYKGTGIGLALCKKIVEKHKGKIWIESEANQGCTFYFTLNINPARSILASSKV